jgi:hypothetical protein
MLRPGWIPVPPGTKVAAQVVVFLMYAGYAAAPAAILYLAVRLARRITRSADPAPPRRAARSRRALRPGQAASTGRDLPRLVEDLHRLEHEYIRIERSNSPAKAARLRAVNLAYDDTLRECCLALGLPEPGERPLSGLARLQTEAELAQHGLVW